MALQEVFDAAIEPLDHAVCSRPHRARETVLDAELGAEQIELVLSGGGAFAQAEQPVGENLSVVGKIWPLRPAGHGASGVPDALLRLPRRALPSRNDLFHSKT